MREATIEKIFDSKPLILDDLDKVHLISSKCKELALEMNKLSPPCMYLTQAINNLSMVDACFERAIKLNRQ